LPPLSTWALACASALRSARGRGRSIATAPSPRPGRPPRRAREPGRDSGRDDVARAGDDAVSEYQCYEFVALDRPLTAKEMAELRGISTRAEITPTRFWNEYHWGDLKADRAKLLGGYFDLHLYFANWGTRRLMLRLPIAAVDNRALGAYLPGDPATLTTVGEHAIVDLCSEVDEPEDDWFEAGGLAGSLPPLRAELLRGDLRVAYLAWLLAVQAGAVGPRAVEPPGPGGLGG